MPLRWLINKTPLRGSRALVRRGTQTLTLQGDIGGWGLLDAQGPTRKLSFGDMSEDEVDAVLHGNLNALLVDKLHYLKASMSVAF